MSKKKIVRIKEEPKKLELLHCNFCEMLMVPAVDKEVNLYFVCTSCGVGHPVENIELYYKKSEIPDRKYIT